MARITEFGFSPNRVAALGENVILLVNLAWSAVLYSRFLTACCGEVGRNSASSDLMKAYSLDLREKIVAAVRRGMSKAQAARAFRVGATSMKLYVKLAEEGKPLTPGKAPGKQSKLGEGGMRLLEEDLRARPAVSHGQRAEYLFELLGVKVSEPTICRAIKRLGYTRKKDR